MPRSHTQDDQQVHHQRRQEHAHRPRYGGDYQAPQESQKSLVSPGAEQPGYSPWDTQEGEQPDEDDRDLDADQSENQWAQEASLPRKPREEGRRLEDHAPYDVYEAVERIGEVVVPSRGGCGSHLHAPSLLMYLGRRCSPQLYWRAPADATRVAPSRLYSPDLVEGKFCELRLPRFLGSSHSPITPLTQTSPTTTQRIDGARLGRIIRSRNIHASAPEHG